MARFRYAGYPASAGEPNVVVDGSPNEGTVLTLTHWPGYPQPPGFEFDLSAEMAFHYLDRPIDHPPADVVTNNHFDQDGLVGLHALTKPALSLQHRLLLIDVAAAGLRDLSRSSRRTSINGDRCVCQFRSLTDR